MQDPAQDLVRRAATLVDLNRLEEAIDLARRAITSAPDEASAHTVLSRALLGLDRSAEALRAAEDAIRLAPELEWAYRLRAHALLELGRLKEALHAAEASVRLEPELAQPLAVLAEAQRRVKRLSDAEATAKRLRELVPDSNLPYSALGLIYIDQKRWKDAEQNILKALEIAPASAEDINNLGVLYERTRRKKQAIEMFHRAAALDPRFNLARDNLFRSVRKYAGISGILIYFSIRILTALPRNDAAPLAIGAVGLLLFGSIFVLRKRRLQKLHPTVQAFYTDERRRKPLWRFRPSSRGGRLSNLPNWILHIGIVVFGVMTLTSLSLIGDEEVGTAGIVVTVSLFGSLAGWLTWLRLKRRRP